MRRRCVRGCPPRRCTPAVTTPSCATPSRARTGKNLVFVAADVHHAEVIRHQPTSEWSFHELVAGPLSATLGRPRPLDVTLNPRSLFARGGVFNFGEVLVEAAHLTVRLVDDGGAVMFTHVIAPD